MDTRTWRRMIESGAGAFRALDPLFGSPAHGSLPLRNEIGALSGPLLILSLDR